MNADVTLEALEVRIAPASLVEATGAVVPGDNQQLQDASGTGTLPFFGPASADMTADLAPVSDLPENGFSIAKGRTITDVAPANIAPAFAVSTLGGVVASLDPTLGLTSLLAEKAGTALSPSGVLTDDSGAAAQSVDALGLGQQLGAASVANAAGLTAPVLLVDVPKFHSSL